jgi:hypothetical protein
MKRLLTVIESGLNRLFSISELEATFRKRGFQEAEKGAQQRLENIGVAFIRGYNLGLTSKSVVDLCRVLDQIGHEQRGFSYEGASMSLALTDSIWYPRTARWRELLEGGGSRHKYMVYVGVGWALARLPWMRRCPSSVLSMHECLEKWLILDGYGFHEGYFRPFRTISKAQAPRSLGAAEVKIFDQGVGRSIWFVCGADVHRAALAIRGFDEARRADLWSGVGLAATYAGGVARNGLINLRRLAAGYEEHLAQGSAFAAKARLFAKSDVSTTDTATEVLCGCPSRDAAGVTEKALETIASGGTSHDTYEKWRTEIRSVFRSSFAREALLESGWHYAVIGGSRRIGEFA